MIRNYVIVAFRNFQKYRYFTLINILGLAIGMCCSILILQYVRLELSYDTFHTQKDQIYRLAFRDFEENGTTSHAVSNVPIGPDMKQAFPEVEEYIRFRMPTSMSFIYEDRVIIEDQILYADNSAIHVFDFPIGLGDSENPLCEPNTIVLTKSLAEKIFPDEDPLGKVINANNKMSLKVTGVFDDLKPNSHIQFNALVSMESLLTKKNIYKRWDGGFSYYTYIKLAEGIDPKVLESKFKDFLYEKINYKWEPIGMKLECFLEPLASVYLHSDVNWQMDESGNYANVVLFAVIAIFIIIIACINFMNLSTAKSMQRAKEVGVRKVIGAIKSMLVKQFLAESIVLSVLALILALILLEVIQPSFNLLTGKEISLYQESNWDLLIIIPAFSMVVGLLAGLYPAFVMSGFKITNALKGVNRLNIGRKGPRNILVVFQFIISTALIASTLIIYRQLQYVNNKELGYNTDNVVMVILRNQAARDKSEVLSDAITALPEVKQAGRSSDYPANGLTMDGFVPEDAKNPIMLKRLDVDFDYFNTIGFELAAGRTFDKSFSTDKTACMINEKCVDAIGWSDPIGKKIERNGVIYTVVGVVKDFHYSSLHSAIEPAILTMNPYSGYMIVSARITGDLQSGISHIEEVFREVLPNDAFEYEIMNSVFNRIYEKDNRFASLILVFTVLAIFIGCMGLFGLAAFSAEQRFKEIGIRKALGGSVGGILRMLSVEYLKLVIISCVIAIPVSWFVMEKWLDTFTYRIEINVFYYLIVVLVSMGVAMITVISQALKAARINPIEAIRYE